MPVPAPPPPPKEELDRVLNVRIVEAKDVCVEDVTANLFCRIMLTNTRDKKFLPKTTGILKRTNRPVWNQDFSFCFRGISHLIVGVYGYHRLSKAVLLGRCALELHSIIPKTPGEVVETWFELYDRAFEKKTGSTIYLRLYVSELANANMLTLESEAHVSARTRTLNYRSRQESEAETLSIFCATFNLGSEALPADLRPWIPEDDFDVFAIGAQEAVFTVGRDMMGKPKFNSCGAEFRSRLTQHFGNRYTMLTAIATRGGQIRLVVFVRTKLAHLISVVDSNSVSTTFNKGGVAISFFYKHTSFAFVNCHLSAHQNKTSARNAEVRHLIRSLKLKTSAPPQLDTLRQFHYVFWMGDLNYRVNFGDQGDAQSPSEATFNSMVAKIHSGNLDELYACDQLQTEMHEGRVFAEFQESRPTFPPTFKVERCFPVVYTKQRSPAWCDRILWWSAPCLQVTQLSFDSANRITTSDHKPVSSAFIADVWSLPPSYDDDLGPCSLFVRSLECHDLRKEEAVEELEESTYENSELTAPPDEKLYHRRTSSDDIYRSTLGLPHSALTINADADVYDDDGSSAGRVFSVQASPTGSPHAGTTHHSSLFFSNTPSHPPHNTSQNTTPNATTSTSSTTRGSGSNPGSNNNNNNSSNNNNSAGGSSSSNNNNSASQSGSFPCPQISVSSSTPPQSLLPTSNSFTGPLTAWRLSPAKDEPPPPPKEKGAKKSSRTPKQLFRMLRKSDKNDEKSEVGSPQQTHSNTFPFTSHHHPPNSPPLTALSAPNLMSNNNTATNTTNTSANNTNSAPSKEPRTSLAAPEQKNESTHNNKARLARGGSLRGVDTLMSAPGRTARAVSTTNLGAEPKTVLNPYVKFRSHFLQKSFSTPLRKQTQRMSWDASDFAEPLPLTVNNPLRLNREFISVKVCHNPAGTNKFKMKKKVPIGSALIPISITSDFLLQQRAVRFLESHSHTFPFEVNLVKSGVINGRLTGLLELQWGPPDDKMNHHPGHTSKRPAPTGKEKKFVANKHHTLSQSGFSGHPAASDGENEGGGGGAGAGGGGEMVDAGNAAEGSGLVGEVTNGSGVWQTARDAQGKVYYYNTKTHATTWDQPGEVCVVVPEAEVLTTIGGWQVIRDKLSGRVYYHNGQTTTWDMPTELMNVPELTTLLSEKQEALPFMRKSRRHGSGEVINRTGHASSIADTLPIPFSTNHLRRCSICSAELKSTATECPSCQVDAPPRWLRPSIKQQQPSPNISPTISPTISPLSPPPPPSTTSTSSTYPTTPPLLPPAATTATTTTTNTANNTSSSSSSFISSVSSSSVMGYPSRSPSSPPPIVAPTISITPSRNPPTSSPSDYLTRARSRAHTEMEALQQRKLKVLADAYLQIQMPDVLSATDFEDDGLSDSD